MNYDFSFVSRYSNIKVDYVMSKLKNAQDKCDSHRNGYLPQAAFPVSFVLILQNFVLIFICLFFNSMQFIAIQQDSRH